MTSGARERVASIVTQGARVAAVASAPGGLRAMVQRRPFSVSAFRLVQGLQAAGLHFETVVDVGANVGQFTAAAQGAWPEATIIAFEPLPAAAGALRRREGVVVQQLAVGALDGTTVFHPHEYSLSSSTLPVRAELRSRPWAVESAPIEVPMRRLDTVLADHDLRPPVLLKLDVQGLELSVLEGATATLRRTDALVLEVAFERSYEGQPLFDEVHRALERSGWSRAQPLDWRLEGGRIVEGDFLYLPVASSE